jgi:hypothetical protein
LNRQEIFQDYFKSLLPFESLGPILLGHGVNNDLGSLGGWGLVVL